MAICMLVIVSEPFDECGYADTAKAHNEQANVELIDPRPYVGESCEYGRVSERHVQSHVRRNSEWRRVARCHALRLRVVERRTQVRPRSRLVPSKALE